MSSQRGTVLEHFLLLLVPNHRTLKTSQQCCADLTLFHPRKAKSGEKTVPWNSTLALNPTVTAASISLKKKLVFLERRELADWEGGLVYKVRIDFTHDIPLRLLLSSLLQ